jgi:Tfp pilus assembly protein PilF
MRNVRGLLFVLLLAAAPVIAGADSVREAIENGNNFFAHGQYEMALFHYRVALPQTSGDQAALLHHNLGACHFRLGQLAEAASEFRQALSLRAGRYPQASYSLGVTLIALNRLIEAEEAFAQAVRHSRGKHAEAQFELGLLQANDGDYRAASESFRGALKAGLRASPLIHNNLGVLLALDGNFVEAMQEFDHAVQKSRGRLSEAAHNLNICRKLLDGSARQLMAELKLTGRRDQSE